MADQEVEHLAFRILGSRPLESYRERYVMTRELAAQLHSHAIADKKKAQWTGEAGHLPVTVWSDHATTNGAWRLGRRKQRP